MCRPAFDVELDRDSDKLLVIHCVLSPSTDLPLALDDTLQDTFCELLNVFHCHLHCPVQPLGAVE